MNLFLCYFGLNARNLATLYQYAFFPTKKAECHKLLFNGEEGGISIVFEVEVLAPVSHSCQGNVTYEHRTAACLPQAVITSLACSSLLVVYFI